MKRRVWRNPGKEYEEQNLGRHKKKGLNMHVWGAIIRGKKFSLVRFQLAKAKKRKVGNIKAGTMNGRIYSEQIPWGPMQQYFNQVRNEGQNPLVLEVGAPVHWGTATKRIRPMIDITNQPHSPSSPDLNVIENVWRIIKDQIRSMPVHPSSQDTLWEVIQKVYDDIPQKTIDQMTDNVWDRRDKVEEVKGKQ